MAASSQLWTIDELGAQVALALSVDYAGPTNGRIRGVPDLRTIRYYTTLGLLDRPAEMRGRTALYHRRHLLQLVAIKRLQARGQSLAQVQEQLIGLSGRALAKVAHVPTDLPAAPMPPEAERSAAFWKSVPAPQRREPATVTQPPQSAVSTRPEVSAPLQGIPLDDAVALLLAARRPIEPDDIEAIRTVAAPLLQLLHQRGLLGPHPEGDPP